MKQILPKLSEYWSERLIYQHQSIVLLGHTIYELYINDSFQTIYLDGNCSQDIKYVECLPLITV